MAFVRSLCAPMIETFGASARSHPPIPPTSPPPPTLTITVRTSGRSVSISIAIVPCPAMSAWPVQGLTNRAPVFVEWARARNSAAS